MLGGPIINPAPFPNFKIRPYRAISYNCAAFTFIVLTRETSDSVELLGPVVWAAGLSQGPPWQVVAGLQHMGVLSV